MLRTTKPTELHNVTEMAEILDSECSNSLDNVQRGESPEHSAWGMQEGVLLSHEKFSSLNYYARVGIALSLSFGTGPDITYKHEAVALLKDLRTRLEAISRTPNHLSETVDD